jgi:glycosyltransferase involved in cell wall biosynthesis
MSDETYLISVILPVYNGESFISEAIESILTQTYKNFELIIINDGSTDKTVEQINKFSDSRIRFIDNGINLGLISSLNKGLENTNGDFVARMDADDICHPNRFELQLDFLLSNPDVVMCGTQINILGKETEISYPSTFEQIKYGLAFRSTFAHPTVMFRSDLFRNKQLKYSLEFPHCEDYELWTRIIKIGKVANLNHKLLSYRNHSLQVSNKYEHIQSENSDVVRWNYIRYLIETELNLIFESKVSVFDSKYYILKTVNSLKNKNEFWTGFVKKEYRELQMLIFSTKSNQSLKGFIFILKKYPKLLFNNEILWTLGFILRILKIFKN